MPYSVPDLEESLSLVDRIDPKYRAVWDGRPLWERVALARYFMPHNSRKARLAPSRPRMVKWYCPFAAQCNFPSGHRYCINVFTGCAHHCEYCYARAYEPDTATPKRDFAKLIVKDMEDLERFDVPPAPVHLSNSTDPFQPLEVKTGHTKFALQRILEHRHRFTTVTILTKNPLLPVNLGYVDLFKALGSSPRAACDSRGDGYPSFVVAVSLAFWHEQARSRYDPGAPTTKSRIEGLRALRAASIPLVLRIDPLFPRSPLTDRPGQTFADFGLPEAQTMEDLEHLVMLAKDLGVQHVVYSPCKIAQPRGRKLSPTMQSVRALYKAITVPEKPVFHGTSWRLPPSINEEHIIRPFLKLCSKHSVAAKYCKQDLIETP